MVQLARAYLPDGLPLQERVSHPLLAPLHAPPALLAAFPPTKLLAGGLDPLLDDAVDFHARLAAAGVDTQLDVVRHVPHGFFAFPFLTGAKKAVGGLRRTVLHAALAP